ncbi:MAG: hypothetical protein ACREIA_14945, partial [Opitutaceae bacterium]
ARPRITICLASFFASWLAAGAVEPGVSREAVLHELGAPQGSASAGAREILFYSRGNVELEDDRVVASGIVSPEVFARQQAREAVEARDRMLRAAERNARLEERGRAILASREKDPAFLALPAAEQLRLWREFAVRYPMIPVHEKIAVLADRAAHEEELRLLASEQQERLAGLEARVNAAEERAARAEREARRARSGGSGYPFFGYGWSHGKHRHGDHDRPSTRTPPGPPAHPMDAARAEAMGTYEDARRAIYSESGF